MADTLSVLLYEDLADDVEQEDIGEEFVPGEIEEEVVAGKLSLYGAGLLGCIAGTTGEFYVQISKQSASPNDEENNLQVRLRPRVNKMKLLGTGLSPPTSVPGVIELISDSNEKSTITFRVTYSTTFAASYQTTIEFPYSTLSHVIPAIVVEPGILQLFYIFSFM